MIRAAAIATRPNLGVIRLALAQIEGEALALGQCPVLLTAVQAPAAMIAVTMGTKKEIQDQILATQATPQAIGRVRERAIPLLTSRATAGTVAGTVARTAAIAAQTPTSTT